MIVFSRFSNNCIHGGTTERNVYSLVHCDELWAFEALPTSTLVVGCFTCGLSYGTLGLDLSSDTSILEDEILGYDSCKYTFAQNSLVDVSPNIEELFLNDE